jgi:hypothetical protein
MIARMRLAKALGTLVRITFMAAAVASIAVQATAEQKKTKQSQSAGQPSAAAQKLAQQILALKHSDELFEPMVPGVIERVKLMHLQTNPALKKDLDEVATQLRKAFESRSDDLMVEVAWLYAARFTEPELKQILAFYQSPIGKKVIDQEPLVLEEAMAGLKGWQEKFAEEVLGRFRAEMKKRGHDL